MKTSELKKFYTVEKFKGIDGNPDFYVLPREMTVIDALKLVGSLTHIGVDKLIETAGYIKDNQLFLCGSKDEVKGTRAVWAVTRR